MANRSVSGLARGILVEDCSARLTQRIGSEGTKKAPHPGVGIVPHDILAAIAFPRAERESTTSIVGRKMEEASRTIP